MYNTLNLFTPTKYKYWKALKVRQKLTMGASTSSITELLRTVLKEQNKLTMGNHLLRISKNPNSPEKE